MNYPAKNIVDWADEEGGPEYLFVYHGVDLKEFDLTPEQTLMLENMEMAYALARRYWNEFEDSVGVL